MEYVGYVRRQSEHDRFVEDLVALSEAHQRGAPRPGRDPGQGPREGAPGQRRARVGGLTERAASSQLSAMGPQWSPSLSVGVESIDAQHRELFRRAHSLVDALKAGRRAEVGGLVEWLGEYAAEHFEAEEALMREVGFPGLEAHRARHEEFRQQLGALVADYGRKGATPLVTLNLHNWLSDWLRLHVSSADVDIGRFVASRRSSGP